MIQSPIDVPVTDIPSVENTKSFFESLKGMGFEDAVSTITTSVVGFCFRLILAIAVFYLGKFIVKKIYNLVNKVMIKREVDPSLCTFVLSLINITLYFVLVIIVIGILGIETSSFIAIFASAGVAIGMALSGTLQNFAGGVLILLLKPYKVGDFIEAQGYSGTVKSIQLFNTIINTPDNKAIILPNGGLSTSSVNNFSLETHRRVDIDVSLSYGTDLAAAKQAILEIITSDPRVIQEDQQNKLGIKLNRTPFVGLKEMGDSAIVFTARVWTESSNYWAVYFEMNEHLYTELQQRGFSFPFPQLDVHIATPEA